MRSVRLFCGSNVKELHESNSRVQPNTAKLSLFSRKQSRSFKPLTLLLLKKETQTIPSTSRESSFT